MLEINNLSLKFGQTQALDTINANIAQNSLLALVGPNGGGKSSLLKIIMGNMQPSAGTVKLNINREKIAYLAQKTNLDRSFPINVEETICMGFWRKNGNLKAVNAQQSAQVESILEQLNLAKIRKSPVSALSGGELQKTLFARIMLQDADLILLDEPFAAIDARVTKELLNLILNWHEQGKTIVAVMHDLEQVRKYFPTAMLISKTKIAQGQTSEVLSQENLALALQNSLSISNKGR